MRPQVRRTAHAEGHRASAGPDDRAPATGHEAYRRPGELGVWGTQGRVFSSCKQRAFPQAEACDGGAGAPGDICPGDSMLHIAVCVAHAVAALFLEPEDAAWRSMI